jgi:hypothetical protein
MAAIAQPAQKKASKSITEANVSLPRAKKSTASAEAIAPKATQRMRGEAVSRAAKMPHALQAASHASGCATNDCLRRAAPTGLSRLTFSSPCLRSVIQARFEESEICSFMMRWCDYSTKLEEGMLRFASSSAPSAVAYNFMTGGEYNQPAPLA